MNRALAVVLSNRLCIEVGQKTVDRRRWPVGGWGGLPAGDAGDAELRRRVEVLLSSPHVDEGGRRALVALYEAPPAEPAADAPDEAPVVEEAEAAAEPAVAEPEVAVDDPPEAASRRGGSRLPRR